MGLMEILSLSLGPEMTAEEEILPGHLTFALWFQLCSVGWPACLFHFVGFFVLGWASARLAVGRLVVLGKGECPAADRSRSDAENNKNKCCCSTIGLSS